ncbi:MAG: META domain-containing protein [Pseudomonadota bacterium]
MLCTVIFGAVIGFCPDETISGYAPDGVTWRLTHLDGAPVAATAEIAFPEEGRITGRGPCNRFTARQGIAYPWIDIQAIAATKRACPDLSFEAAYFDALSQMTLAEVSERVLILSDATGQQMVFAPAPAQ